MYTLKDCTNIHYDHFFNHYIIFSKKVT